MATVASIDYAARLIYLSAATMNVDIDTMDVYREVRALRRTNEAHRKYQSIIVAGGNVEKIAGLTYTPSYVQLLYGTRIIPYGVTAHRFRLIRDTFTDDGFAGIDCFDRSGLSVDVDIDVQVDKIEIVKVVTGGNEYTLVQISDAVLAAAQLDPIHSRVKIINGTTLAGAGTPGDPMRPA